jgi:hypothetical protein
MTKPIKDLEVEGGWVNIHYFFNQNKSIDGIDVYDSESGQHIGELLGVSFPDEDDPEEMKQIVEKINAMIWHNEEK